MGGKQKTGNPAKSNRNRKGQANSASHTPNKTEDKEQQLPLPTKAQRAWKGWQVF
jgi:hypothetical protein